MRKSDRRREELAEHMRVAQIDGVHASAYFAEADALIARRKELRE